ncbi:MAG: WD40/YVTN/BNR-like repeat-containing protein [Ignavibacteria bacterium]
MIKKISNLVIFLLLISFTAAFNQQLDMNKLEGLKARAIGPAGMSGRVTAIDVVQKNPSVIYVGTASGGLWKTTSGGVSWTPIFDTLKAASIGAIAIDQNIPDIIWVGTGEGNPRNSQNSGNGVYKSLDGGKTWIYLGLENSRNIHRIIIDPRNSDVVYVGVQGSAFGDSEERGVFKTTDGGKTWNKILYVNERTGIADLVMDPSNPNKLFAAMWEFRREPWFFTSGGKGSGLYVTFDGGNSWKKLSYKDGLPSGELGRIGVAIARSNPEIVYALIEAKVNALHKSTDGGFKWFKVSDKNIGDRPFYYAEIYVDPKNENRVYNIYTQVSVSEDGGKSFNLLISKIHPDHHAFYIHPENPNFLIDGNDGGLAISYDRGKTWRFVENLPVAQFYHINVDNDFPYNVYGGLQDNGSWRGPSRVFNYQGISNFDWQEVGFGDGFDVLPDPDDSRFGYAMSQGGNLFRYDSKTGIQKSIRPVHPDGIELRFNWNAALAQDPFDNSTIYYGSQFLHKSTNKGDSWEIISPDLTTNDTTKQKQRQSGGLTPDVTSAENYCTIVSIAPSPVKQGVIWVGTDDGNLQLTTDGGKTWKNVVENIKGVPKGTWIPQIYPSRYNEAEAFVVFDNHRRNDWTPYLYYTSNFGKSWTRLADEKKVYGYCLSVVQDFVEPNLIFLGTEFGLYVSTDFGKNWTKWKSDFPTVSTTDLIIHPRENDLVIGTFGRSIYIIDNIAPLREIAKEGNKFFDKVLKLFNIPNAYLIEYSSPKGARFPGHAEFFGENLPAGAMITFQVKLDTASGSNANQSEKLETETQQQKSGKIKIEIFDEKGNLIRTLNVNAKDGLNRTYWNLDRKGIRIPRWEESRAVEDLEPSGAEVLPGKYLVKISYKNFSDSTFVNVLPDPRIKISLEDLRLREDALNRLYAKTELMSRAITNLKNAERNINLISEKIADNKSEKIDELKKKLKAQKDSIRTLAEKFFFIDAKGIQSDPNKLTSKLYQTQNYLLSSYDKPSQMFELSYKDFSESLNKVIDEINQYFQTSWIDLMKSVNEAELNLIDKIELIEKK